jgi:hypothetical protein
MLHQKIKYFLVIDLLFMLIAFWRVGELPHSVDLDASLLNEPVQTQVRQVAFKTKVKDVEYTIQPLFEYDLVGLVVSKHNADTWWDHLHREWNDKLNIVDLCVVWGNNARNGAYAEVDFSSGQFTCNFRTTSDEVFAAFDQTAISNNHLLTDNSRIAKQLGNVRIGDQIHFHGHLVEYSHHQGMEFKRGTSTVRTDSGNGACETVFIDYFEVIKPAKRFWRLCLWLSFMLALIAVIAWFAVPMKFNDK